MVKNPAWQTTLIQNSWPQEVGYLESTLYGTPHSTQHETDNCPNLWRTLYTKYIYAYLSPDIIILFITVSTDMWLRTILLDGYSNVLWTLQTFFTTACRWLSLTFMGVSCCLGSFYKIIIKFQVNKLSPHTCFSELDNCNHVTFNFQVPQKACQTFFKQ